MNWQGIIGPAVLKFGRSCTFILLKISHMKRLLICIGFYISFSATAQNKQPVTVTDMLKIKSIGNITLTRDGSKAAFTVTSIENDGDSKLDYKYITQVWMT